MYEEGGRPGRNGHLSGELTTTSLADTLPGSLPGVQRGSSPLLPHPLHPPLSPVTKQGLTTAFLLVPPPRSSSLPCGRYHGLRQQVAQSLVSEIFIHLFFFLRCLDMGSLGKPPKHIYGLPSAHKKSEREIYNSKRPLRLRLRLRTFLVSVFRRPGGAAGPPSPSPHYTLPTTPAWLTHSRWPSEPSMPPALCATCVPSPAGVLCSVYFVLPVVRACIF